MKNENEQYFQPDITDIRIGYECELWEDDKMFIGGKITQIYQGKVGTREDMQDCLGVILDYGNGYLIDKEREIRTPYLTKEQIEAEGWAVDERSDELFSRKDNHHFYKGNLSLSLFIGYLKDEIIWYSISIYNSEGTLFKGSCKDINTFRYVYKLIEND